VDYRNTGSQFGKIDLGEWAAEEKRIPSSDGLNDNESWSEQLLDRD